MAVLGCAKNRVSRIAVSLGIPHSRFLILRPDLDLKIGISKYVGGGDLILPGGQDQEKSRVRNSWGNRDSGDPIFGTPQNGHLPDLLRFCGLVHSPY